MKDRYQVVLVDGGHHAQGCVAGRAHCVCNVELNNERGKDCEVSHDDIESGEGLLDKHHVTRMVD